MSNSTISFVGIAPPQGLVRPSRSSSSTLCPAAAISAAAVPPAGPPPGFGEQPYGLPPQGTPDPRAYANPYYGPGAFTSREHPQAVMILVFGILSIVLCPLFAPVAWSMGGKARRDIRLSGVRYTNEGLVTAGWIMGLIVSSLMIVGFVFILLAALAGGVLSAWGMATQRNQLSPHLRRLLWFCLGAAVVAVLLSLRVSEPLWQLSRADRLLTYPWQGLLVVAPLLLFACPPELAVRMFGWGRRLTVLRVTARPIFAVPFAAVALLAINAPAVVVPLVSSPLGAFALDAVWVAAHLHDWGAYTPWAQKGVDHTERSLQVAEAFLTEKGYPEAFKKLVLECIEFHHGVGSDRSTEALLMRDADSLDSPIKNEQFYGANQN